MTDYNPYLFVVIFGVAAALFALTPVLLSLVWSKAVGQNKPGPIKNATYECGLESKGDAWIQFHAEYYLYGLMFLIFDVEVLFLLPFAVAFKGLAFGAFAAILIFIFLLLEGFLWAWKKGILVWR